MHLGSALTSGTAMTLDARFTQLRRGESLYEDAGCAAMASRTSRQQAVASASVRNRRLAIQMSRRPAVVAALNRGVPRNMPNGIMTRLGRAAGNTEIGTFRSNAAFAANNFRRRSNSVNRLRAGNVGAAFAVGGGGVFRRGGGNARRGGGRNSANRPSRPLVRSNSISRNQRSGSLGRISRAGSLGNLSRSGSLNRLTRSQSLQSLSGWANNVFRGRGTSRGRRRGGRGRRGGIIQGFITRHRDSFGRVGRGGIVSQGRANRGAGRINFRGRNLRGGSGQTFRSFRSNNNNNLKFRGGRGSAGRGFRGARGRGRGNRGRQKEQVPTKEALDMEIDEYMSTTKSHLDKEIESYMNQPAEEGVLNTNQTNCTVTESWD